MDQLLFLSGMLLLVHTGEAAFSYDYIGCYRDSETRDLSGPSYGSPIYTTPDVCAAICGQQGFSYFGVQNSDGCFCGDSYGSQGEADNCDMACTGNIQLTCGGVWANEVYSIDGQAPESEYIGCFREQNDWALQQAHYLGVNFMTVDICMALCYQKGTAYFGVDDGVHCHCGNTYGDYGPSDVCTSQCPGDTSLPNCGGFYATSVYEINLIGAHDTVSSTAYQFTLPHNGHQYILETSNLHHATEGNKYCADNYGMSLSEIKDDATLTAISDQLLQIQTDQGVTLGEVGAGVRSGVNLNKPVTVADINAAGWNCAVLIESGGAFSLVGKKCNGDRAILCESLRIC